MVVPFPLRVKLQLATVVAVLCFGTLNMLIVSRLQFLTLKREQDRRIRFAGELLTARLAEPLLYGDVVMVQNLLEETRSLDESFVAVVMRDSGGFVTQHSGSPHEMEPAQVRVESFPILGGKLGSVDLFVSQAPLQEQVGVLIRWVAVMVLIILALGMGAAVVIAKNITKPVERMVVFAREFRLQGEMPPLLVNTGDELQELAQEFTTMAARVAQLHRQATEQAQAMARLEHLATVGTLAAGVAHEINNPLAGIRTGLERLLRRMPTDEQTRRYSATLKDALARIERAVQGLLRFARAVDVRLEKVDLRTVVEDAWELVRPCWEGRDLHLECLLPEDLPLVVADGGKLRDVFVNLFLNACDAMGLRGRIVVSSQVWEGEARVTVADSGPGVPQELRERIFDPFFSTKGSQGTGLGLAVSRAALQEMGGGLELLPTGPGAHFQITLRVAEL